MIRKAIKEDCNSIAELIYMIWKDMELEIVQKYSQAQVMDAIRKSQIDSHYRNHLSHIWVYEVNEQVAAIIVVYDGNRENDYEQQWHHLDLPDIVLTQGTPLPVMESNQGDMYIESVATFPEFRGKGVATQLIRHVLEMNDQVTWGLNCDVTNEKAFLLYKKLGFSTEEEKALYGHRYYYMTYQK